MMKIQMSAPATPSIKVFISYSHDSEAHIAVVRSFADRLRKGGIEAEIDQYHESPPEGWPKWMDYQLRDAHFVLIVCSDGYAAKLQERVPTSGRGVKWEALLSFQQLYDAHSLNSKFIPLTFDGTEESAIPSVLRPFTIYKLPEDYERLYRRLTEQPKTAPPEVGAIERFSEEALSSTKHPDSDTKTLVAESTKHIELRINRSLAGFNNKDKDALLKSIAAFLEADYEVKIVGVRSGSVLLTLELSPAHAEKLLWAVKQGLFEDLQVTDATVLDRKVARKGKPSAGTDALVEQLKHLTTLEVADLVKQLEEKWGVSGTAPVAVAAAGGGGVAGNAPADEKTSFDVILKEAGANKIAVIKEVRACVAGLGLAEAKALVEGTPKILKEGLTKAEAEEIKKRVEAAGARAEIK